jgi:hypothetical protein
MIIQEHFDVNGRDFVRTYSDENRYVVREGIDYSEACDPAEFGRTYTEDETEVEEILSILTGGAE